MRGTLINAILIYIRLQPGVRGSEIVATFGNSPKTSVSNTIGKLKRMGLIENRGRGGRWSEWYPVEVEPVDPEFLEIAQTLLKDLNKILKSEREVFLAKRLKELFPSIKEEV